MTKSRVLGGVSVAALALVLGLGAEAQDVREPHAQDRQQAREDGNVSIKVPPLMAEEHEELHAKLAALVGAGGETGAAAHKVEEALAPHFEEENRYALPPLGLLSELARGRATEDMRPAIELSRHVAQNLDRYIDEHREIAAALNGLEAAGKAEGNSDAVEFAAELRRHARQEEELFYPTAILIGRYLERELGGP
ncbi:MAG TPA: hemerythrin domain-containing protein [Gammaproteobacteria bacterium]|nr:hemerythrin domain-containing protein [Gammaproteobacteria bacterium]